MVIQKAQEYAEWHRQYSLLPIYVRLVKTDDLFLSPASKFRPGSDEATNEHNCYIEARIDIIYLLHHHYLIVIIVFCYFVTIITLYAVY